MYIFQTSFPVYYSALFLFKGFSQGYEQKYKICKGRNIFPFFTTVYYESRILSKNQQMLYELIKWFVKNLSITYYLVSTSLYTLLVYLENKGNVFECVYLFK